MTFPVFYEHTAIAEIVPTPNGPEGAYREDWLASPDRFPISLSLPLDRPDLPPQRLAPWLANLLPEGEPLRAMTRALGVAQEDVLGLIERTGGDLAGALRIGGPREADGATYRVIDTPDDLERILDALPAKPFLVGDDGVTMSLAGAQEKLPVALVEGRIAVPLNGAPSTHILKPDNPRLAGSVANEAFCMILARRCRLDVAPVTSGVAGKRSYLLVDRYDREGDAPGPVRRRHQEDFCQALGRPPAAKYEHNQTGVRGPSLAEMFGVVREHMTAVDITRLLDAVIFNIAIGNVDSHAKNYSILLTPDGSRLAPLYDLMSGLAWANITQNHSQSVGGQRRGRHIYGRHWRRMAEACGLAGPATVRRVRDLTTRILAEISAAAEETRALPTGGGMLPVFVAEITERVRLVQAHAAFDGIDDEDGAEEAVAEDRPRDGAYGG